MDFKLRTNAKYFTDEQLLEDLRSVSKKLGDRNISGRDYIKHGNFSQKVFYNRFGSWNGALQKAGLGVVREHELTDEALFENLEKVWLTLGRQPFYGEMKKPLSAYSTKPYDNRWGGWMKACEAFIKFKKNDTEFERLREKSVAQSRTINEKIRLKVFKRDNYACVICGKSPANYRGVILHLDHIKPFSKGGDNSLENLRTLCNKCNLGRNNDETV
jgi:hypothetical protein